MLQSIEVVEGGPRKTLRRGVDVACELYSDWWDDAVALDARDLSADGIWLESALNLRPGDRVRVTFRPPNWRGGVPIVADGVVRRVDHQKAKRWGSSSGMGIEFRGLEPWAREALNEALTGLPPALPEQGLRSHVREQLFWIEELLADFDDVASVDRDVSSLVDGLFENLGSAIRAAGLPLGLGDQALGAQAGVPISLAA